MADEETAVAAQHGAERKGLWRRLRGWLGGRGRARRTRAIEERFSNFLAICSANDRFLARLAQMMEVASSPRPVGLDAVASGYRSLSTSLQAMVESLVELATTPGAYAALPERLAQIEAEVGRNAVVGRSLRSLPLVVRASDPDARRPEVVGGKAASLASLARLPDLVVPPFFVLTARAYRNFLEAMGSQKRINELLWTRDRTDPRALRAACDQIRRGILTTEVPAELAREIVGAYRDLRTIHRSHLGVAVRSSALAEDSEVSFAGQFQSVLGVKEEGLLSAFKHVVAGKYRYEAVRYARLNGFLDEEVAMPVLFMAMVQPVASGVAYSRDPDHGDRAVITAVRGLAVALVDGSVTPDRFVVARALPNHVLEQSVAPKARMLRCSEEGGVIDVPLMGVAQRAAAIPPEVASAVARLALRLEEELGRPQDVEWALDEAGLLHVVQSRRLETRGDDAGGTAPPLPEVEGHQMLLAGGVRASRGVAIGPVVHVTNPEQEELERVPAGAVLVVPTTSPLLSGAVERTAAIVAEAGSPTGHMATVAREFRVPTLVGATGACAALREGSIVTVDAWRARVYDGEVAELKPYCRVAHAEHDSRDTAKQGLRRLLEQVAPLTLPEPSAPGFTARSCTTLHDVARFIHQRAMAEMFATDRLSPRERRAARRLRWAVPMEVLVLDLGGGVSEGAGRAVELHQVSSLPLQALLEGMTDPRLRWSGPVGFDLKGFMSVVVRSAADDQRYGEPSFAACSREYMHFSSRLAYHFATCDAMCSESENQNYARFAFFGGAAVAERREWRAHFLACVLMAHGFGVSHAGDRVEALLGKLSAGAIEDALVLVGRLMVSARHLDMVIDSGPTAEAYAAAFLGGDFDFEFVRKSLR